MNDDLKLLDCTLRDGGYVNNWRWGFSQAKTIIRMLVKAGIEVVEVGFLRDVSKYNPNVTVCNTIEELNRLLPEGKTESIFSAMAMRSNYDIEKLDSYCGKGIEIIRVTAHDYDIDEGLMFAERVKQRGYKVSINPINIMGYPDSQILKILERVNKIQPYQFSIVDTFGSMKRRDLDRIVSLVDNNLDKNIRIDLHLHENMAMSFSLAQAFIDKHLGRPVTVDASLLGMGRTPGNLPIELIADYLNDYQDKSYDMDSLMDAIQDYVAPIKGKTEWGYTPAYFLSARFNLHRNYAEYYLKKGDLTNRDINHILAKVQENKKTVFDEEYANMLYEEYNNNRIDDKMARKDLKAQFGNKTLLLIAPGHSIIEYREVICNFIDNESPVVVAVNFLPNNYKVDFAFFSNNKRFVQFGDRLCKIIVTSNITEGKWDYQIDYNSLSGAFDQGCNSLIMVLKLLKDLEIKRVVIAGADGFSTEADNYYSSVMVNYAERGNKFNMAVITALKKLDMRIEFLTPSAYNNIY